MLQQSLLLNIIPFTPPVTKAAFPFYKQYNETYCPVYIDMALAGLLNGHLTRLEQAVTIWFYTDFKELREDAIVLDIDLTVHIGFANHYYPYLKYEKLPPFSEMKL